MKNLPIEIVIYTTATYQQPFELTRDAGPISRILKSSFCVEKTLFVNEKLAQTMNCD